MTKNKSSIIRFFLSCCVLVGYTSFSFGIAEINQSVFDIMHYKEVLKIQVETNLDEIIENKRTNKTFAGILTFEDVHGNKLEFEVNLDVRGRYRRMFSQGVPPLKIDFKKKELRKLGLAEYDDLKLVTLFQEDKSTAFQTLVKEYLIYKAYNVFSDDSYRVQLLEIEFFNKNTNKKSKEYGFILEDTDQLADRINAKEIDTLKREHYDQYDSLQVEKVAFFQYLIGNGDWNPYNGKNIKLLLRNDKVIAIPYDFDFCGLVDAPYAVPNNQYGRLSVRDRVYLGNYATVDQLSEFLDELNEDKKEIIDLFENCRYLTRENREKTSTYLHSFFDEIRYRKKKQRDLKVVVSQNKID